MKMMDVKSQAILSATLAPGKVIVMDVARLRSNAVKRKGIATKTVNALAA